jgi:molybdopterin converting factor small subunit
MPLVSLRPPLRDLAGGDREIAVDGATVGEVVTTLERQHPKLAGWVLDERGRLREHVKVFVNGEVAALEQVVGPDDRVQVLPSISGGSGDTGASGRSGAAGGSGGTVISGETTLPAPPGVPVVDVPVESPVGMMPPDAMPGELVDAPLTEPAPREAAAGEDGRAELLVGTRKGLFVLRGPRGGAMEIAARQFAGYVVEYAMRDRRTGTYYASVTSHFGPKLYLTDDPLGRWDQAEGLAFPEDAGASVDRIWVVVPGEEDGVLWAGVAPAALFRSEDGGRTWSLNRPLWDHPSREQWQPGFGGLCLHSICTWPGDPQRLAIAISAAGVWLTDDGGGSWRRGVKGLVPRYLPEESQDDAVPLCVHNIHRMPLEPETIYMQFHGGVYRSDDAGESWVDIGSNGLPSDFGFPLVIDPSNPDRCFVIPLTADADRVTPDGKVRVYETLDRGVSWEPRWDGLPQDGAYLTVLRQAFGHDGRSPLGLYFGAESGEVFGSADGGVTWGVVAEHLAPVTSVRSSS